MIRSTIALLAALFLVPLIALGVAAMPYWDGLQIRNPLEMFGLVQTCLLNPGGDLASACSALQEFNWLAAGAGASILLGVGLVAVVVTTAFLTGWSRFLLSYAFSFVSFAVMIVLGLIVLGHAGLLAGSTYLAESYLLGVVHPIFVIAVGIGGVFASFLLFANVASMFRKAETSVVGVAVEPIDAPHIHRLVGNLARELKTKPPKNIVLGLDANFFATSAKVNTPFRDKPLRGETLYMSLPLLRMLSTAEAKTIIGHELAHFSGADTIYSKRFSPAYVGLGTARSKLSDEDNRSVGLWALPAVAAIDFVLGVFSRAERRIGRSREMRADKMGSEVGSPEALASSLIKMSVLGNIWSVEFDDMVQRVQVGRFSRNLSRNFTWRTRHDIDLDKMGGLAALSLDAEIAHPTDTHPVTRDRVRALGVDPEPFIELEAFKKSLFPEKTIISKSDSIERIEEQLTDAYQHWILQALGTDESEERQSHNAFVNLLSMWLAKMVTIDGHVDNSEIEVAQAEAIKFDPGFDAVSFKEHCRHPDDIPPTEKLIYWGNQILTTSGAEKLKLILHKIAEADGKIEDDERELLDQIDEDLIGEDHEPAAD